VQLEATLASFHQLAAMMKSMWAWPIVESIHFVGLTLLFGSIAAWDLRLLGLAKSVPVAAFHRLVPFAVLGFAINGASGFLFLAAYPDQYVYNPAFHLKMVCVLLAGVNVACFYLGVLHRVSGAVSLVLWTTVIVCGRMITFFRPSPCRLGEAAGLIADCIVR
jgi:hypothetical protein